MCNDCYGKDFKVYHMLGDVLQNGRKEFREMEKWLYQEIDPTELVTKYWAKANNIFGWSSYLKDNPLTCDIPAYASPIHTKNLENLPPAMILIGGIDQFVEESIKYAKRLNKSGVSTELHVYPFGFHGFEMLAPELGISNQFHQDIRNGLKKALHIKIK